jgi:hypothetical protein
MAPHQPVVTESAEQPSNLACSMIVVNRQLNCERRLVLFANRAAAFLALKDLVILF